VLQGGRGMFAIRQGKWKLILGGGSGGFSRRVHGKAAEGEGKGQLYDLHADVSESVNLYEKHPEVVERLTQLLDRYKKQGRSVPRP